MCLHVRVPTSRCVYKYVCLPVSTCVYMYVCLQVDVSTSTSVYLRLHVSTCTCVYKYVCLHVSTCVYMYVCLQVDVSTSTSVYLCLHVSTCTCVYKYVCLHVSPRQLHVRIRIRRSPNHCRLLPSRICLPSPRLTCPPLAFHCWLNSRRWYSSSRCNQYSSPTIVVSDVHTEQLTSPLSDALMTNRKVLFVPCPLGAVSFLSNHKQVHQRQPSPSASDFLFYWLLFFHAISFRKICYCRFSTNCCPSLLLCMCLSVIFLRFRMFLDGYHYC